LYVELYTSRARRSANNCFSDLRILKQFLLKFSAPPTLWCVTTMRSASSLHVGYSGERSFQRFVRESEKTSVEAYNGEWLPACSCSSTQNMQFQDEFVQL